MQGCGYCHMWDDKIKGDRGQWPNALHQEWGRLEAFASLWQYTFFFFLTFKNWNRIGLQCCASFLLFNKVNQPYAYIYPHPLGPPSHSPLAPPITLYSFTHHILMLMTCGTINLITLDYSTVKCERV